jgi:hypothetical protein
MNHAARCNPSPRKPIAVARNNREIRGESPGVVNDGHQPAIEWLALAVSSFNSLVVCSPRRPSGQSPSLHCGIGPSNAPMESRYRPPLAPSLPLPSMWRKSRGRCGGPRREGQPCQLGFDAVTKTLNTRPQPHHARGPWKITVFQIALAFSMTSFTAPSRPSVRSISE